MKRWFPVLVACLLAACSEEHGDLRQWMAEASRDIKVGVAPLPQVTFYESATYDGLGAQDPFASIRLSGEKKRGGGGLGDPNAEDREREQLEAFPLESLKYIGNLVKDKIYYAIIQADSALYHVKAGNYMGQNFGRISKIEETVITLREVVQDAAGDWVERESTMLLQGQEG